jgi:hypothetical protein
LQTANWQLTIVSLAVTQLVKVEINILVGVVVCNVVVGCPGEWTNHTSHAGGKLFITSLSHALQHGHLLVFDFAINLKMIEIRSAHGHTIGINLCGTTTTQSYSYNAQAKYVGETPHGYVHIHDPFPLDVEGRELEIPTKQSLHVDWHSHWAWL